MAANDLANTFVVSVCADDVMYGKPDPESYLIACERLSVEPAMCVAIEDTDVGVASAVAAGLRCAAVTTTMPADRLWQADVLIRRVDTASIESLLRS